jgi:lysophospholipase L1-like esterase
MRQALTTLALAGLLALVIAAPTNAATPTPPFSQCPALGADASCALLIYITPTGAVGVLGDPSQGPFDSIEDTLIGVQNDSRSSIASVPIAATSGKPLFGFDGDGLCTYLFNASCLVPGASGYEGPGVFFSGISTDLTSGTVNFAPAIPPGGHAYFSLEEALATVPPFDIAPGPPTPVDIKMVAVGDSYSTAQGVGNYDSGKADAQCLRGPGAWPRQLQHDALGIKVITHLACTGAKVPDLFSDYKGNPAQIDPTAHHGDVQLVTLTIGGDDVGFASTLRSCFVTGSSCAKVPDSPSWRNRLASLKQGLVQDVYPSLRLEYPNALIVHVGYPRITPPQGITPVNCGWLSVPEQGAMDRMETDVENTIQAAVDQFNDPNVQFASALNALKDHWLCTTNSWMNPVNVGAKPEGHPTIDGYTAYMKAVAADLGIGLAPGF